MFQRQHYVGYAAIVPVLAASAPFAPVAARATPEEVVILGEKSPVRTELVSHADLNLSSAKEVKRLNSRIAAAVDRVCLREYGRDGLQVSQFYRCEKGAWMRAEPQVDAAIAQTREFALLGTLPARTTITVSAI